MSGGPNLSADRRKAFYAQPLLIEDSLKKSLFGIDEKISENEGGIGRTELQNAQECDATEDDQRTKSGYKN